MPNVKKVWDNRDYPVMGWHDCRIYAITFPLQTSSYELLMDIDYIFNVKSVSSNLNFLIAPCDLVFTSAVNLEFDLDFGRRTELEIDQLRREECTRVDANVEFWTYIVDTHVGTITLDASGYRQVLRQEPIWTNTIDLEEERNKP